MLITTRDERLGKRLAGIHASVVVDQMSPQEAQDLLGKWQMDPFGSPDDEPSMRLLEALGYIPLAITQAAAFISENHISLTQYLEMFRKSDSDVQDLLNEDVQDRRRDAQAYNSIIRTWKISFDLISKQKPRAAEMLSLMAILDRQGIPESLLRHKKDRNIDFTTALGILRAFSLVSAGVDGAGYEIHRLVQLATRKWLEIQGKIGVWQEKALLVVTKMFPTSKFENWKTCESLLPHAQKVIQNVDVKREYPFEFSTLLSKMAHCDLYRGQYEIACARYSAAIEIQKQTLGMDHKSTLTSMNNLAITYAYQRRFEEAERLSTQVLEVQKRLLGAEHRDTLSTISILARTYRENGRLEEAEKLSTQVLEVQKRLLGAEHLDTLSTMSNLASTYAEQGQWQEAEKLYLQVLEARERVLGAGHPATLMSINNLANTHGEQGQWEEAEKLYLQVLEARERVLRAEHPATLMSINNLAVCCKERGRHSEAIALMGNVVELSTKSLGANHPATKYAAQRLKRWSKG